MTPDGNYYKDTDVFFSKYDVTPLIILVLQLILVIILINECRMMQWLYSINMGTKLMTFDRKIKVVVYYSVLSILSSHFCFHLREVWLQLFYSNKVETWKSHNDKINSSRIAFNSRFFPCRIFLSKASLRAKLKLIYQWNNLLFLFSLLFIFLGAGFNSLISTI